MSRKVSVGLQIVRFLTLRLKLALESHSSSPIEKRVEAFMLVEEFALRDAGC